MTEPGPRDRRLVRGLWVGLAALAAAGLALRVTAPAPQVTGAAGREAAATAVGIRRLVPEESRRRVELSGVVRARRAVRLASETEGRVVAVGADDLDPVRAGQLLVEVDPRLARVAVERAEASLARAESELGLALTSLDRQRSLAERSVASDSALDDASTRSRVADAALREARADLERARDALAKKTLRAPFAGVLRGFALEVGEYVRVGQELGELLDLEAVRITVGLTGRQVVRVRSGAPVRVRVGALPHEAFEGRVLRVAFAADTSSRQFPVEVEVPNPERRILPGMVGRVVVELGDARERLIVPREAVGEEYGLHFVWVVARLEDGLRARRRRVRVRELPFDPARLEIVEGVRAGEAIATSGVRLLRDGAPVRPAGGSEGVLGGEAP